MCVQMLIDEMVSKLYTSWQYDKYIINKYILCRRIVDGTITSIEIDNFDSYKTVFIGYPIWWGDLPMIMYTFLEDYNFDGKNVYLFNTHEGSGDAGTYKTVKSKLPKANVNIDGLALDGKTARSEAGKQQTINWLKESGF